MVAVWVVCGAAAGILVVLIGWAWSKHKASNNKRKLAQVSKAMIEYFRKSGVEVAVGCVHLHENNRLTAFVESEPMKQFRLSHIIEIAMRDHVHKTCGLELDKVYWRFPIKVAAREPATAPGAQAAPVAKKIEGADEYINEGLVNYRDLPKFEATEIPWEKFEEVTQEPKKSEEVTKE
jgi:kynurenine formamidase